MKLYKVKIKWSNDKNKGNKYHHSSSVNYFTTFTVVYTLKIICLFYLLGGNAIECYATVHLSPDPHSRTSHWKPDTSPIGNICTTEIGRNYKSGLFSPRDPVVKIDYHIYSQFICHIWNPTAAFPFSIRTMSVFFLNGYICHCCINIIIFFDYTWYSIIY